MAWIQGEKITATKINSENTGISNHYSHSDHWGTSSYTTPPHYFHNRTGRIFYLSTRGSNSWFAKGDGQFWFRTATGEEIYHRLWWESTITSYTKSATVNIQDYGHGIGWYRVKTWARYGTGNINMYYPQDDCKRGEKLVIWDNPISSGNKLQGSPLTASMLNSHRVGTI